jgi:hypothetical protein
MGSYIRLRWRLKPHPDNYLPQGYNLLHFIIGFCLIPPVFSLIVENLIGLPADVARVTYTTCLILLPWPSAIGNRFEEYRPLRNFAFALGATMTVCLVLITFTPAATFWYRQVSGLSVELSRFIFNLTLRPGGAKI